MPPKTERKPRAAKSASKAAGAAGAARPKTTRKPRMPKSLAPKRPKTAYIIFLSEQRQNIKANYPDAIFTEIPKIAAEQWHAIKPAQKAKYERAAEQDRERYKKDMLTYVPSPDDKKKKKKKDPNAVKKAKTAYNFFTKSRFEKVKIQNPGMSAPQIMSSLGAEWKELSDRQREPFVKQAAIDKQRYETEKGN